MASTRVRAEKARKGKGGRFYVLGHFPSGILTPEQRERFHDRNFERWLDVDENAAAPPDAEPRFIYPIVSVEGRTLARAMVKLFADNLGCPRGQDGTGGDLMRRGTWFTSVNAGSMGLARRIEFEVALKRVAAIAASVADWWSFQLVDGKVCIVDVTQWEGFLSRLYRFGQELQEIAGRDEANAEHADGTGGGAADGTQTPPEGEWSRPMALTELADRVLKDPRKWRKLKSVYGDRLKKVGPKSWQFRLDGLSGGITEEIDRP